MTDLSLLSDFINSYLSLPLALLWIHGLSFVLQVHQTHSRLGVRRWRVLVTQAGGLPAGPWWLR